jgi:hypothetical protein
VVRCGAHLSNLALCGSKVALRLFGTKVVQEAFESEVVSALKRATDAKEATDTDVSVCRVVSYCRKASDAWVKGDRRAYVLTSDRHSKC